jgi:aryl-phospho-beta-D-glucosidase BglC (GH1 family)
MKKLLKNILFTICAFLLAVLIFVDCFVVYSQNYTYEEKVTKIENNTGLVQASRKSLYDADGNQLVLRGVNAGQILLQEGWMSPFALEPLKNEDGSYVKDADGNIQYPEFTEEEFREGIKSNPNLNTYDMEELMKIYWDAFFTEEDFRIIKEDLQMNTIRLPFYYLNILNEDLSLKEEEDAFAYLDWFMEEAAKNELYVVLDLHGAPGSQNGFEHSGRKDRVAGLWTNEEYVNATVEMWQYISKHYTQTKPELGKWIATYDILNEPTYEYNTVTTLECWEVMDQIYDVIRANGDKHVITMEGCWDFAKLPDPADYGWENVQYEYHWYNWWSNILPTELVYAYYDIFNMGRDYEVPTFIGEFTCFEDKEQWAETLALMDQRNYSWTIWNYKSTVTGWWTTSWGVYTCQLKAITENEDTKCNIATCTYEEYLQTCEKVKTENCVTATLYEVIQEYNNQKN